MNEPIDEPYNKTTKEESGYHGYEHRIIFKGWPPFTQKLGNITDDFSDQILLHIPSLFA
jgi:hypothetical protein